MGLDIYLMDDDKDACPKGDKHYDNGVIRDVRLEIDSDKYPEHLWKKTYLRSSYNDGGFNSVTHNLVGRDLYTVFEPRDEYEIVLTPERLEDAELRAQGLLAALQCTEPMRVTTCNHNVFTGPSVVKAEDVLALVREEISSHSAGPWAKDGWGNYSNRNGDFFGKGDKALRVIAAIPGMDALGSPAVHLVYEEDLTWYIQAAEILLEFIAFAKTLNKPVLHWSG